MLDSYESFRGEEVIRNDRTEREKWQNILNINGFDKKNRRVMYAKTEVVNNLSDNLHFLDAGRPVSGKECFYMRDEIYKVLKGGIGLISAELALAKRKY